MIFRELHNAPLYDGTPRCERGWRCYADVGRLTLASPLFPRMSLMLAWQAFTLASDDGRDLSSVPAAWAEFSKRWFCNAAG